MRGRSVELYVSQKIIPIILLYSLSFLKAEDSSVALEKYSIALDPRSSVGGVHREGDYVDIFSEFRLEEKSYEQKVWILEQELAFYRLMNSKKVDLKKKITAAYSNKSLSKVLEELIPSVPVKFKGVSPDETVESMAVANISLEIVLRFIDDAAGVYFSFSEDGILVTDKSKFK